MNLNSTTENIELARLVTVPSLQFRGKTLDEATVDRYQLAVQLATDKQNAFSGKLLKVVRDTEKNCVYLVDGFHRRAAFQREGVTHCNCEVYEGDFNLAIYIAAISNSEHGLPRSDGYVKNAILALIKLPFCSQWTGAQIAEAIHCSPGYANQVLSDHYNNQKLNSEIQRLEQEKKQELKLFQPIEASIIEFEVPECFEVKDALGQHVPQDLRATFYTRKDVLGLLKKVEDAEMEARTVIKLPCMQHSYSVTIVTKLREIRALIEQCVAYMICEKCDGSKKYKSRICSECEGLGFVNRLPKLK